MVKHKLDAEPERYNLRSKKLCTDVNHPQNPMPAKTNHKKASKSTSRSQKTVQNKKAMTVLERLPNELLRDIYLLLDTPSMLAFKLVCKASYGITLNRNGGDIVDIKPKSDNNNMLRIFYGMLRKIESEVPDTIPLERLTCLFCARTLARAPVGAERDGNDKWMENGFSDEDFDRERLTRTCLECIDDLGDEYEDYHVYGDRYSICGSRKCESKWLHRGPSERPCEKVLRAFFEKPDENIQSSRPGHHYQIFPSDLCSAFFFLETKKAAMEHLNATIQ